MRAFPLQHHQSLVRVVPGAACSQALAGLPLGTQGQSSSRDLQPLVAGRASREAEEGGTSRGVWRSVGVLPRAFKVMTAACGAMGRQRAQPGGGAGSPEGLVCLENGNKLCH